MDARCGGRHGARLKRLDEFVGEHARLFSQIACADPVFGVDGFVGLREEIANFFNQVVLRRIELFAFRALEISCGVIHVCIGALFGGGLSLWRELGRDHRCRRPGIFGGLFGLGGSGRGLF